MSATKEKIKTVLICVLLAGMLYLMYSVWFFDSPFETMGLYDFFGITAGSDVDVKGAGSDLEAFGIRPLGVFMRDEASTRGSVYESEKSDAIYKTLRPELAKAFESVRATEIVGEDAWTAAITGRGVLLDYRGDVPVEAIKLWLDRNVESSALSGRFFMLSTEHRNVTLYIKNSTNGTVYEVATGLSSNDLQTVIEEITAPAARLAVEREEEDFRAISPENIIAESRAKVSVISAYNSYSTFGGNVTNACLESFRLRDVTPSTYSEADGTEVYVADMVTLKISPDGIAAYTDSRDAVDETLGIGVEFEGETPTLAEKTETARALVSSLAGKLPGSGGIYIIGVYENGDKTEIVFGRHIGGVPVDMKGSAYFARVEIEGASVRTARVNLRGYDVSTQSADILSDRLAAAAVHGSGKSGDMNLRYSDSGSPLITPSWFIGGVKKISEEAEDELVES